MKIALTIAGSDSSGGAGIQRDLAVFRELGVWGFSVVTSVTAQSPQRVESRFDLSPEVAEAQIRALNNEDVAAAKTGMVASAAIVECVARVLGAYPLVVDPVFASSSGAVLLDEDGIEALTQLLLPRASVVTPNASEAERLTGIPVTDLPSQKKAARALVDLGAQAAVVTGGHIPGPGSDDVLWDGTEELVLRGGRTIASPRGTGCAFSAALAAYLAQGRSVTDAAGQAKAYVTHAIERANQIGGAEVL